MFGVAVWFGTQAFSLRDNFSDQVNPWYFVALYAAAFFLGLIAPSNPGLVGVTLALSQLVSYFIYPNIADRLGNLFPIAAALLLACAAPVVLVARLASTARLRVFQRSSPL
ncbi:MAG: hypothetical protein ACRD3C_23635 [Vicinamibacterales bacterium]